jgi:hypothetical protein
MQKESRAQNTQMNAVGYISDTEEIIKATQSNFQHDSVAPFKLSKRSPLPPAMFAIYHPEGHIKALNGCRIK